MSAAEVPPAQTEIGSDVPVSRQELADVILVVNDNFAGLAGKIDAMGTAFDKAIQALRHPPPDHQPAGRTSSAPDTDQPTRSHQTRTPSEAFTNARAIDADLPMLMAMARDGQVVSARFIEPNGNTYERRGIVVLSTKKGQQTALVLYRDESHPLKLRSEPNRKLVAVNPVLVLDHEPVSARTRLHDRSRQEPRSNRDDAAPIPEEPIPVIESARGTNERGIVRQAEDPSDHDESTPSDSTDEEGSDYRHGRGLPRRVPPRRENEQGPPIVVHTTVSDERKAERNRFLKELEACSNIHALLGSFNLLCDREIVVMITSGSASHAIKVSFQRIVVPGHGRRVDRIHVHRENSERPAERDVKGEDLFRLIDDIVIRYPAFLRFKDGSLPFYPWERAAIHFLSPLTWFAAFALDETEQAAKLVLVEHISTFLHMTPGGQLKDNEYEDTVFPDEKIKLHFRNLAKEIKSENFINKTLFRENVIMRWEAVLAIIGFLVGGERGRAQVNAALTSRAPFHDTKHWPFPMNEWYQHFRKTKGLLPLDATPQASSGQPVLQLPLPDQRGDRNQQYSKPHYPNSNRRPFRHPRNNKDPAPPHAQPPVHTVDQRPADAQQQGQGVPPDTQRGPVGYNQMRGGRRDYRGRRSRNG
jgi:hypothetical protein